MPDFSVDRRSLMIAAAAAPLLATAAQEAAQAQVPGGYVGVHQYRNPRVRRANSHRKRARLCTSATPP